MNQAEQNDHEVYRIINAFSDCSSEFVGLNRYHVFASEQSQLDRIIAAMKNADCSFDTEPIFVANLAAMEVTTPHIIV